MFEPLTGLKVSADHIRLVKNMEEGRLRAAGIAIILTYSNQMARNMDPTTNDTTGDAIYKYTNYMRKNMHIPSGGKELIFYYILKKE